MKKLFIKIKHTFLLKILCTLKSNYEILASPNEIKIVTRDGQSCYNNKIINAR